MAGYSSNDKGKKLTAKTPRAQRLDQDEKHFRERWKQPILLALSSRSLRLRG
jgi:hypothetical protein